MQTIGIDEVGRGCWAGPLLVVAARQTGELPEGVADSKALSKRQRNTIFYLLTSNFQFGEGWVQSEEIDDLGLTKAMRLGVSRALEMLGANFDSEIIMDGNINYCSTEYTQVETVVKADSSHPIVSAASIYAKVMRDQYMAQLAKSFPKYGFEKHVGYGTAMHRSALKQYGPTAIHRKSYKPIKQFIVCR